MLHSIHRCQHRSRGVIEGFVQVTCQCADPTKGPSRRAEGHGSTEGIQLTGAVPHSPACPLIHQEIRQSVPCGVTQDSSSSKVYIFVSSNITNITTPHKM